MTTIDDTMSDNEETPSREEIEAWWQNIAREQLDQEDGVVLLADTTWRRGDLYERFLEAQDD